MAVLEFNIAWNKGRARVLNPKSIFTCGTNIKKATAAGIAIDTIRIGMVRSRSFAGCGSFIGI
jgi:hypothetical protein